MKATAISTGLAIALLFAVAVPALAQTGTVQQFLDRIERLPPGPLALLSPDAGRLKREFEQALTVVFREQQTARREGRPPATCIPDRMQMSSSEALGYFNAVPRARRERLTVVEGTRMWMAHKYPCR